ncbi:hypothetical protein KLP28_00930 [Nocardioidaceae bacterium]|nr:hypothetical protein KLP28_00930 [Nocardioidaceae bacterium]
MSAPTDVKLLSGLFAASGAVHLVRPQVFEPLMPPYVPAHREVIVGSGVVEAALAVGLLLPGTRRAAGWGSVAVLLGVMPAHLHGVQSARRAGNTPMTVGHLARIPLQLPMLRAALRATRS